MLIVILIALIKELRETLVWGMLLLGAFMALKQLYILMLSDYSKEQGIVLSYEDTFLYKGTTLLTSGFKKVWKATLRLFLLWTKLVYRLFRDYLVDMGVEYEKARIVASLIAIVIDLIII